LEFHNTINSILFHWPARPLAVGSPSPSGRPAPPYDPIKGRGAHPSSLHSSPPPISHSPSPSALYTGVPTAAALTTISRPPHCLPSSGEWTIGFPAFHSPSPAPWPTPLDTGAAGGQAPASSVPPVHRGPRPEMVHGSINPVHYLFNTKIIQLIQGNSSFAQNPLSLY
jgi:hypothetical protein